MYDYTVKLRDREVKFRKWKVKDKQKFKRALKEKTNPKLFEEALVFDCLEDPNITLTPEEYKWLMIQIRKESVGPTLHYDFGCLNCTKEYQFDVDFDTVFEPTYKKYESLKANGVEFKMGEIQNQAFYKEEVSKFNDEEERTLFDFLMHVKQLNGSDTFTFDELFEYVNNMDVDTADQIFTQWEEMKFSLNENKTVKCPHCNNVQKVKFDVMPGFLPQNWSV